MDYICPTCKMKLESCQCTSKLHVGSNEVKKCPNFECAQVVCNRNAAFCFICGTKLNQSPEQSPVGHKINHECQGNSRLTPKIMKHEACESDEWTLIDQEESQMDVNLHKSNFPCSENNFQLRRKICEDFIQNDEAAKQIEKTTEITFGNANNLSNITLISMENKNREGKQNETISTLLLPTQIISDNNKTDDSHDNNNFLFTDIVTMPESNGRGASDYPYNKGSHIREVLIQMNKDQIKPSQEIELINQGTDKDKKIEQLRMKHNNSGEEITTVSTVCEEKIEHLDKENHNTFIEYENMNQTFDHNTTVSIKSTKQLKPDVSTKYIDHQAGYPQVKCDLRNAGIITPLDQFDQEMKANNIILASESKFISILHICLQDQKVDKRENKIKKVEHLQMNLDNTDLEIPEVDYINETKIERVNEEHVITLGEDAHLKPNFTKNIIADIHHTNSKPFLAVKHAGCLTFNPICDKPKQESASRETQQKVSTFQNAEIKAPIDDVVKLGEGNYINSANDKKFKSMHLNKSEVLKVEVRNENASPYGRKKKHKKYKKHKKHDFFLDKVEDTLPCCHQQNFNLVNVLKHLGAEKYFPGKLSVNDVLKPTLDTLEPPIIKLARGLLHLDFSVIFEIQSLLKEEMAFNVCVYNPDDFFESSIEASDFALHPLDGLVLLLQCCNNLLKQVIITKLAKCQIAIPLVVPNYDEKPFQTSNFKFTEWSMRQIGVAWKPQNNICQETELLNLPGQFVSFLRLSNFKLSKSKLASRIIRNGKDDKHCYFIDRDESNCSTKKISSSGLIDIFWNTPKGEVDDSFRNPVLLFNLHGCCSAFTQQTIWLCATSHILVIFVDDSFDHPKHRNLFNYLSQSKAMICFLYNFTSSSVNERFMNSLNRSNILKDRLLKPFIDMNKKNVENIADVLKIFINSQYFNAKTLSNAFNFAENLVMLRCCPDKLLMETEQLANSLICLTDKRPKIQVLLLQQYLNIIVPMIKEEKRLRHRGEIPFETYANNLQSDRLTHEKMQQTELIQLLEKQGSFYSTLLQSFDLVSKNPEQMLSFIRLISIMLDTRARKALPALRAQYVKLRENSLELKREQSPAVQAVLQNQIKETLQQLQNASFGVEHILRETSTCFSILIQCKESTNPFVDITRTLPRMHAQMLADGIPLEVMNGDCGFVDVMWLRKVFQELCDILGVNEHVCVVTVLGVQSSGKSTLLNTMFGINFAVSSGRCTKGIYAQLIEVDETYKQRLGCRYIVILDTEGLRAPELKVALEFAAADTERDNELATFIIGLADLTIINVMGETDSDIHETLQITVHAMLRMKRVKLAPMCLMIHQNVNDTLIKENSVLARENMQNILNETAVEAARSEGNMGTIRKFADVIDFNCADPNQICYLPSFYSGSHINPKYVSKVKEFRGTIFERLGKKANHFITFPELSDRINDLWKSILEEDFVFSFKNALEKRAYQQLENEIIKWNGCLTKNCEQQIADARNKIKQCMKDPEALGKELKTVFDNHMDKHLQQILKEELGPFLENQNNKIMLQWKQSTIFKLEKICQDLIEKTWRECNTELQIKITEFAVTDSTKQYEDNLRQIAKRQLGFINIQSKENQSEKQLKVEFECFWCKTIEELKRKCGITEIKKSDVQAIIWDGINGSGFVPGSIQKDFNELFTSAHTGSQKMDARNIIEVDWRNYVKQQNPSHKAEEKFELTKPLKQLFGGIKEFFSSNKEHHSLIVELTTVNVKWLSDIENMLASYLCEARAVTQSQPRQILEVINVQMKDFEESQSILFTGKYRALLAYTFYNEAIASFQKQQEAYIQRNDPILLLESNYKETYWNIFYGTCKNLKSGQLIADVVSNKIASVIRNEIEKSLPSLIEDFISTSNFQFTKNKHAFLAYMLCDLGNTLNRSSLNEKTGQTVFGDFCSLFEDPFKFMENYFTQKVEKEYDSSKSDIERMAGTKTNEHRKLVESVIERNTPVNSIKDWLTIVQNKINQSNKLFLGFLPLLQNLLKDDEEFAGRQMATEDLEEFKSTMSKAIFEKLQNIQVLVAKEHYRAAAKRILSTSLLMGCKQRCPLCGAFCECNIENHETDIDHSAKEHWPNGLSGWRCSVSTKLTINNCTMGIATNMSYINNDTQWQPHPYKDYRKYYPKWHIPSDGSLEGSLFWKWFLGHYGEDLAKHYNVDNPDIPIQWRSIEFEAAKAVLETEYNITLRF